MRRMGPVNVILYQPRTPTGKAELAKRVADAHATLVIQRIKSLNAPSSQKRKLVDAIKDTYSVNRLDRNR